MAKINLHETVIVSLKDGQVVTGTLLAVPEQDNPFWYISLFEDSETTVGISESSILMIVKPSNKYMKKFLGRD